MIFVDSAKGRKKQPNICNASEALSCRRLKYLGQVDFDPDEIKTLAPTKLLKFIKALNLVGNRLL